MTLLVDRPDVQVHHATWQELIAVLPRREDGTIADALLTDTPYSERVHAGHDGADRNDGSGVVVRGDEEYGHREKTRGINYPPWSDDDVRTFVAATSPIVSGWYGTITDHVLAGTWAEALDAAGRYVFAPIPIVEIGSRVRLVGDGPSSWTCYLVVARPSDGAWLDAWRAVRRQHGAACALPGAYVYKGHGDRVVMGGKRTDCMEALVRDYSRPGDLVIDPWSPADIEGTGWAIEAKHRRRLSPIAALEQAEDEAWTRDDSRPCIAVVRPHRSSMDDCVVVMRLTTFEDLVSGSRVDDGTGETKEAAGE